jgi:phage terminase Nu1 subunit (DNA packaging protein)
MQVTKADEPGLPEDLLKDLLTKRQFAELFGVTLRTVDIWHQRGIAPRRFEIGKVRLYRRTDVERWIEERLVSPEVM